MRIRREQMQAFEEAAWRAFELRVVDHWKERLPGHFHGFDETSMITVAQAAIAEARAKGLESERDIVMYSDLALANRTGFAENLQVHLPRRLGR
jgi:hypothetical protein